MSISEISAVSPLPLRRSARITATAAREAPSSRPSSSIQWSRPPWTSVNGRRSSTLITTRSGSSHTTSARRTAGSDSTRPVTPTVSRRKMFVPRGIAATARICSGDVRDAPRTSTLVTANRGVVRSQWPPATTAAGITATVTMIPTRRRSRARRLGRRRRGRPTRCPSTNAERSPRSARTEARLLGELRPLGILLSDDPDLVLEHDREVAVDTLSRQVHEGQDVRGGPATPVHDEVRVLGGDLGAVDPFALEAALLDHPRGDVARRVLPHAPGGGERQRLGGLLDLEPLLHFLLDLRQGTAVQAQAAADQHGACRRVEVPVGERARGRFVLAERPVRVQIVDGAHKIADPAVRRSSVHGQSAADRGGNSDEALDAAQIDGGGFSNQGREAHARPGDRLLAVELLAPETALEPQDDAAHAAVLDEQVVAASDHRHR